MKYFLVRIVKYIFSWLPPQTPHFVYLVICKPPFVRRALHWILEKILPQEIVLPEGKLFCLSHDPVITAALAFHVYEPIETEIFRQILQPGMVVCDIGANIGYYSVIAAAHVGSEGTVYSFEPEKNYFDILQKNILENHLTRVVCFPDAISNADGEQELFLADQNKMMHSLVQMQDGNRSVMVRTRTLDSVLAAHKIERVDFVKMDIEGAEGLALLGMRNALATKITHLLTEFAPSRLQTCKQDPSSILEMLKAAGFTIFRIDERARKLKEVTDIPEFLRRGFVYKPYTNLFCTKDQRVVHALSFTRL